MVVDNHLGTSAEFPDLGGNISSAIPTPTASTAHATKAPNEQDDAYSPEAVSDLSQISTWCAAYQLLSTRKAK